MMLLQCPPVNSFFASRNRCLATSRKVFQRQGSPGPMVGFELGHRDQHVGSRHVREMYRYSNPVRRPRLGHFTGSSWLRSMKGTL